MKTITEMTRELGGFAPTTKFLEAFAALVLANNPPDSSMAWQEGNEAGRLSEREACAKLCDAEEETANEETWYQCAKELAKQIRARGNT